MNIINPYRFGAGGFDGFGNASREFDGTGDYIDMGDVLDSVTSGSGAVFTLTAWVKSTSLDDGIFFGKLLATGNQRSYFFRILSTGELAFILYGTGGSGNRWGRQTSTSGSISADTWHHVAVIYDQTNSGDYVQIFIDGVEDTTLADYLSSGTFNSIYDGTGSVQISGLVDGTVTPWGGNLADVRIYDADIGSTEVANLASGIDYQTNLVGWWLDDDDDVLDNAGSNDGTNFGSTYSTDGPAD